MTGTQIPARQVLGGPDPTGTRIDLKDPAAVRRAFPRLVGLGFPRPEEEIEAGPVELDANESCPQCGAALPDASVGDSHQENGQWVADEYRRCIACASIVTRREGHAWRPIEESDLSDDVRIMIFLDV
jgi:hypothetical protein